MNYKFNVAKDFIILRAFCKGSEMRIRNGMFYSFVLIIYSLYMFNALVKGFYFIN